MTRNSIIVSLACLLIGAGTPLANAQLVGLPDPHLLTTMPMGAQRDTTVEVEIGGQHLEEVSKLIFSHPGITAKQILDENGDAVENKFLVTASPETPLGIHDARVISRLGISSPRAFTIGELKEETSKEPRDAKDKAAPIAVNSITNAVMPQRAIDHYSFPAKAGKRYAIECAAVGIDSKLTPVVIVADQAGRDLLVNRTGGVIDFLPTTDGTYLVKVHDLTYQGSSRHFYRLSLREIPVDGLPPRHPSTEKVSAASWPPPGLAVKPKANELEPNDQITEAQKITLPCDISGSFFPAADVDTFEFAAKKGEVWWVEVGSERIGHPTDPFVFVQGVIEKEGKQTLVDVAELYDIASPLKTSSNGYSYDGPPYDIGSPDVLGKIEIPEDGLYRLQVRDLFGGTRDEPGNQYRLIVRKEQPDFALAAWAVHMTLRNGDRAAFSKPIALRTGDATVLEVLAIRRDGFEGDIELEMTNLPQGVEATGLKIPAGKSVGHIVITADPDSKAAFSLASISGKAQIGDTLVTRPCRLATMEWPVRDAKQEIPAPRLVNSIPVSVSPSEEAPVSFSAEQEKVWEVEEGGKLTIPLKGIWREEFTGTSIKMKAYGTGFDKLAAFEVPLKTESYDVEIDLAKLKTKPGEYLIAFYGGGVAKYRYNPKGVEQATKAKEKAATVAAAASEKAKTLAKELQEAEPEKKAAAETAAKAAEEENKTAAAKLSKAEKHLAAVTKEAAPKDRVDIHVSTPLTIVVNAKKAEEKAAVAEVQAKP